MVGEHDPFMEVPLHWTVVARIKAGLEAGAAPEVAARSVAQSTLLERLPDDQKASIAYLGLKRAQEAQEHELLMSMDILR